HLHYGWIRLRTAALRLRSRHNRPRRSQRGHRRHRTQFRLLLRCRQQCGHEQRHSVAGEPRTFRSVSRYRFRFEAITNEVGITGTPVIDPVTQTLYVDAFTTDGVNYFHNIHALNLADGSEKPFSPVVVNVSIPGSGAGSSGGMLPFQAIQELQRSALTLAGGVLYVA